MDDTTKLEGIFNDIKSSVDRLERRVGGVEHRVAVISREIDKECKGAVIVLEIPMRAIMIAHLALGVIAAYIILRIIHCMVHGGV